MAEKLGKAVIEVVADMAQFMSGVEGAQDKALKHLDKVSERIDKFTDKCLKRLTQAATLALTGIAVAGAKWSIDFGRQFDNVRTIFDGTADDLEKIRRGTLNMAGAAGSAADLASAAYQAISANITDAGEALEFVDIASRAAVGGLATTFEAVDLGTGVLKGFGYATSDAGKIFDQVQMTVKLGKTTFGELAQSIGEGIPMFATAGLEIHDLLGGIAFLSTRSIDTAQSVTFLKYAIQGIIKPATQQKEAFKEIGTSAEELRKILSEQGLPATLKHLAEKLKDYEATGKDATAQTAMLFGSVQAFQAVAPALTGGIDELIQKTRQIAEATGEYQQAYEKVSAGIGMVLTDIKNKVAAILIDEMTPLLQEAADWIRANEERIKEFVREGVGKLIDGIRALIEHKDAIIGLGTAFAAFLVINKVARMSVEVYKLATAVGALATAAKAAGAAELWTLFGGAKILGGAGLAGAGYLMWEGLAGAEERGGEAGKTMLSAMGPLAMAGAGVAEVMDKLKKRLWDMPEAIDANTDSWQDLLATTQEVVSPDAYGGLPVILNKAGEAAEGSGKAARRAAVDWEAYFKALKEGASRAPEWLTPYLWELEEIPPYELGLPESYKKLLKELPVPVPPPYYEWEKEMGPPIPYELEQQLMGPPAPLAEGWLGGFTDKIRGGMQDFISGLRGGFWGAMEGWGERLAKHGKEAGTGWMASFGNILGTAGMIGQVIQGVTTFAKGIIALFKGLITPEWKKVTEDLARSFGFDISEELAKQIAKEGKRLESRTMAIRLALPEIMAEEGLSIENLRKYRYMVQDILGYWQQGFINVGQAADPLYGALRQLIDPLMQAKEQLAQMELSIFQGHIKVRELQLELREMPKAIQETVDRLGEMLGNYELAVAIQDQINSALSDGKITLEEYDAILAMIPETLMGSLEAVLAFGEQTALNAAQIGLNLIEAGQKARSLGEALREQPKTIDDLVKKLWEAVGAEKSFVIDAGGALDILGMINDCLADGYVSLAEQDALIAMVGAEYAGIIKELILQVEQQKILEYQLDLQLGRVKTLSGEYVSIKDLQTKIDAALADGVITLEEQEEIMGNLPESAQGLVRQLMSQAEQQKFIELSLAAQEISLELQEKQYTAQQKLVEAIQKLVDLIQQALEAMGLSPTPITFDVEDPTLDPNWPPGAVTVGVGWNVPDEEPRLQHGAIIDRPTLAWIGENPAHNPEFVFNKQQFDALIETVAASGAAQGGGGRPIQATLVLNGRVIGTVFGELSRDGILKIDETAVVRMM